MFITNVLRIAKVPKSKLIMVKLRSTVSGHVLISFREKAEPKKELIHFDPLVGMDCLYKEEKKIKTMKKTLNLTKQFNEHTYGTILE